MAGSKTGVRRDRRASTSTDSFGEGWRTSDDDEIARRRRRAAGERFHIERLPNGAFRVRSPASGRGYLIELRSPDDRINSCDCLDFQTNGLGTCKHIEAALLKIRKGADSSHTTEIYLDRRGQYDGGPRIRIRWAKGLRPDAAVRRLLAPFFSTGDELLGEPTVTMQSLRAALAKGRLRGNPVHISVHIEPWIERLLRERERREARSRFLADVAAGKRALQPVKRPLYEYQREGMLHLAFKERALLGDEMGLGKTVQAIAACELLRELHGVERVLVISPVSLKGEWQEQVARFSDSPLVIIEGSRSERSRRYRQQSFYYLANYEQALSDSTEIEELLAPDIIVLDEAQRIKNWQSKTAEAIKRLRSRYVFVLTGTAIENRIDEIYSISQVIDPHLFGPLFRFNRDFYELDERGRPVGYKNLDLLHRRLRPVLMRRRKQEVEGELPDRVVKNYFVAMAPEQRTRYDEHAAKVARLMQAAQRRALSPDEFKRLQSHLACMRMVCDSPYILDRDCRVAPKIAELRSILEEQLAVPENKVIIFSEWTRMLELVEEELARAGIAYALHTGAVNPRRRRAEIDRFKDDAHCRVFLTSDAGATGLNLQAANIVVNLDLPWNPAKLEQRIARAWRKHQRRTVSVINLICEESIEHRILRLIEQKRALADGVLDGTGEHSMALPSGRKLLIESLSELMELPAVPAGSPRTTRDLSVAIEKNHPGVLRQLSLFGQQETPTILAVVKDGAAKARQEITELAGRLEQPPAAVEVIDESALATIRRLIDARILMMGSPSTWLHRPPEEEARDRAARRARIPAARARLAGAIHKQRMGELLHQGGFVREATVPFADALAEAFAALALALDRPAPETDAARDEIAWAAGVDTLPKGLAERLRAGRELDTEGCAAVTQLIGSIDAQLHRWEEQ